MNKKKQSTATAIIFIVAIATFLAFLILKFCGFLTWSWWWITAPLWAPTLFFLLALGFMGACLMVLSYAANHHRK